MKSHFLFLLVAGLALLNGCDSTEIDPFKNQGQYFTLYGYIDQSSNFSSGLPHSVRVIPVTRRTAQITDPTELNASIDARVFTINMHTGQEIEWQHSLDRLSDGSYGHVFRSDFFVQPAHRYRLEVRRSDGTTTTAETTVPSSSSSTPLLPAPFLSSNSEGALQNIILPGINTIWDITVIYRLRQESCFNPVTTIHRIPYGRVGNPTENGWELTTFVSRDKSHIDASNNFSDRFLCAMGVEVKMLDDQWELPSPHVDPNSILFSNTSSNVTNGYGFWGSIGLYQNDWQISDSLAMLLGQPTPVR